MNLLGRLLLVLLRSVGYRGKHYSPLADATLVFRVLPHDLDINIHVNNARYLQWMDLGRFDFMNRLGIFRTALRRKWMPVLGGVNIRYHRPLHFLQQVKLITRVVSWDEKWFYMEQRFVRGGKPIATAYAKALFRGPDASVPTSEVLALMDPSLSPPPFPPEIAAIRD
ncbi:MAG TPA: acyl-CoA thioesterase [Gemmatimonadales bacterium]|nr:acyl-CoA thioesterase [Gemmatimonadales bacterium]